MSLNRYAARVDSSQPDIVAGLRKMGFTVDIIGYPVDLLIHSPTGEVSLMEVKPDGWKKWSKKQKAQEDYCKKHKVPVVTSLAEACKALGRYMGEGIL